MGFFGRGSRRQKGRERRAMRDHLDELEDLRGERIDTLGQLAMDMAAGDGFDRDLLRAQAAEVASIDGEADLVARALEEGMSLEQLEQLAQGEAGERIEAPAE